MQDGDSIKEGVAIVITHAVKPYIKEFCNVIHLILLTTVLIRIYLSVLGSRLRVKLWNLRRYCKTNDMMTDMLTIFMQICKQP